MGLLDVGLTVEEIDDKLELMIKGKDIQNIAKLIYDNPEKNKPIISK